MPATKLVRDGMCRLQYRRQADAGHRAPAIGSEKITPKRCLSLSCRPGLAGRLTESAGWQGADVEVQEGVSSCFGLVGRGFRVGTGRRIRPIGPQTPWVG